VSRLAPLLAIALTTGCTYLRPSAAQLQVPISVSRGGACLVVLMPGMGDDHDDFIRNGFLEALKNDPAQCDVQVLDAHFGYYREANITDRLASLLEPVRARYLRIWLVGVSLGGYGAALTARAHPELVDGVVLISPFLGVPRSVKPVVMRIEGAGGMANFSTARTEFSSPRRHFMEAEPLWGWLADHLRADGQPAIHLAWGADDGFARTHRALAGAPGLGSTLTQSGGHDWTTFASLFAEFMRRGPPWQG